MDQKLNFDIRQIMQMLPHRSPMLLVDRVEDVIAGEEGVGIKNVTADEPFFHGHFPDNPVMPGVLQIEAMAQTCGVVVLSAFENTQGVQTLLAGIDKVRFKRKIIPGDVLTLQVKKLQQVGNIYKFQATAFCQGLVASEAILMAMVITQQEKSS